MKERTAKDFYFSIQLSKLCETDARRLEITKRSWIISLTYGESNVYCASFHRQECCILKLNFSKL